MGISVLKLRKFWTNKDKLIILSVTKELDFRTHGQANLLPTLTRVGTNRVLIRKVRVTTSWQWLFLDVWERQTITLGSNKTGHWGP